MKPASYDTTALIGFLQALHTELRGQRVRLIWDGLPAHKSRFMQTYLRTQCHWLRVERLPGYAPELNPTESLWENVKGQELATTSAAKACTRRRPSAAMGCVACVSIRILFSFLQHAGLSL